MNDYFAKYLKVAPFSHALWRATEAKIISSLKLNKPVLDIGCGFGEFGGIFYETCVEVGIDKSEKDLDIAKRRGIYDKLIVADAVNLPIENNSVSSCVSISTLEHIKDADKVIGEVYRVLKPGGIFVFTVPTKEINMRLAGSKMLNRLGSKSLARKYIKTYHQVFKHRTVVSEDQWKEWLTNSGFRDIQTFNTLSDTHLATFEFFLLTSVPSQILRLLTGSRMVWNNPIRTKFFTWLFDLIEKNNENKLNASNIAIVAVK